MELIRGLLSVVAFYHDTCFRYLYCERVKPLNYLLLLKRQTHTLTLGGRNLDSVITTTAKTQ